MLHLVLLQGGLLAHDKVREESVIGKAGLVGSWMLHHVEASPYGKEAKVTKFEFTAQNDGEGSYSIELDNEPYSSLKGELMIGAKSLVILGENGLISIFGYSLQGDELILRPRDTKEGSITLRKKLRPKAGKDESQNK